MAYRSSIDNPPTEERCASTLMNVWVIEHWNLSFICNLVLGIWDFIGL